MLSNFSSIFLTSIIFDSKSLNNDFIYNYEYIKNIEESLFYKNFICSKNNKYFIEELK